MQILAFDQRSLACLAGAQTQEQVIPAANQVAAFKKLGELVSLAKQNGTDVLMGFHCGNSFENQSQILCKLKASLPIRLPRGEALKVLPFSLLPVFDDGEYGEFSSLGPRFRYLSKSTLEITDECPNAESVDNYIIVAGWGRADSLREITSEGRLMRQALERAALHYAQIKGLSTTLDKAHSHILVGDEATLVELQQEGWQGHLVHYGAGQVENKQSLFYAIDVAGEDMQAASQAANVIASEVTRVDADVTATATVDRSRVVRVAPKADLSHVVMIEALLAQLSQQDRMELESVVLTCLRALTERPTLKLEDFSTQLTDHQNTFFAHFQDLLHQKLQARGGIDVWGLQPEIDGCDIFDAFNEAMKLTPNVSATGVLDEDLTDREVPIATMDEGRLPARAALNVLEAPPPAANSAQDVRVTAGENGDGNMGIVIEKTPLSLSWHLIVGVSMGVLIGGLATATLLTFGSGLLPATVIGLNYFNVVASSAAVSAVVGAGLGFLAHRQGFFGQTTHDIEVETNANRERAPAVAI